MLYVAQAGFHDKDLQIIFDKHGYESWRFHHNLIDKHLPTFF